MIPLLIIRHGETPWNAQKRIQGQSDIPLSEAGRRQVSEWRLPPRFADFDWYSSPLQRARETARIMGAEAALCDALREMNWGEWEGRVWREVQAELGPAGMKKHHADSLDFRPPGGESPRDVQQRLQPWLAGLDRPGIAIAHKGVLQAIHAQATGWSMRGKPPLRFTHGYAYLFGISSGKPAALEMSIPLTDS